MKWLTITILALAMLLLFVRSKVYEQELRVVGQTLCHHPSAGKTLCGETQDWLWAEYECTMQPTNDGTKLRIAQISRLTGWPLGHATCTRN